MDVMLQNFQALGARVSIKLFYLFSHLDYFPENLSDVSNRLVHGTYFSVPFHSSSCPSHPMGFPSKHNSIKVIKFMKI